MMWMGLLSCAGGMGVMLWSIVVEVVFVSVLTDPLVAYEVDVRVDVSMTHGIITCPQIICAI